MTKQEEFIKAIKNNSLILIKELLNDSRVDPSACGNYAIVWTSYYGHIDIVKTLLNDPRIDPSDSNNYAIRWASHNGHSEVIKELLKDSRVDPTDMDNEAIRASSYNGHSDVVKILLNDPRVYDLLKSKNNELYKESGLYRKEKIESILND